ncbi:hypothetical protein [Thomasclavelia spiroformis]|nr:hypothetical protein [Thomasclavelia spiroformis]
MKILIIFVGYISKIKTRKRYIDETMTIVELNDLKNFILNNYWVVY